MTDGLYFVKVKGEDRVYTADYNGGLLYRDCFKKETATLEVLERIPPEVVIACVRGVRVLNLARTMGFAKERE